MKDLKNFIVEANINKGIDELVSLLKKTVLKDTKLSKDDFEELENGTFNLCNVPQDGKLADDFFKGRSGILSAAIHTSESESYKEIALVQAYKDDIFVRINLDTENGEGYKKGDIISIDMSKEIKDKLI
jgi:hypothetical protein